MKSTFAVASVVQCVKKNSFLNESSQHKLDIEFHTPTNALLCMIKH